VLYAKACVRAWIIGFRIHFCANLSISLKLEDFKNNVELEKRRGGHIERDKKGCRESKRKIIRSKERWRRGKRRKKRKRR
jgi:hypothetical protein